MTRSDPHGLRAGPIAGALAIALLASTFAIAAQARQASVAPVFQPSQKAGRDFGNRNQFPVRPLRPGDDGPAAPVPEPGTMALASMGLIALGSAVRKFRRS